ncbi:TPA: hypothetical protein DCF80_03890 [Candidatus Saccharibacteria bacterium]|nr:hypothetical protein [Candidatus Saccharibacteria bacterium]HRK40484.1 hypothetical protein [Candidatus Saccharibacteria bacterium]
MSNDGVLELCWTNARGVERCAPVDQAPWWVQDLYYQEFPQHNGTDSGSQGLLQDPSTPWPLTEPVDKPWYQDIWETVSGWLENGTAMDILIILGVITVCGCVLLLPKLIAYLQERDLADDAYNAEWEIEDLNYAASYNTRRAANYEDETQESEQNEAVYS